MPKAEINIDLQCMLCNKKPKFSDVSHLLTHIASKSHLAARFKLQIQAQSEIAAKEKLDQFDFWYRTNNLDALLAERLAAKEHKKTQKSRASVSSNVPIKKENGQAFTLQSMRSTPFAETPVQGFRAPVPRMHLWPEATNTTPLSEWDPSPVYATPTARRQVPNFTSEETPAALKLDPKLTTPWKPEPEDGETAQADKSGEKLTDSAKLKGVLWPGMDLFDSATPEMKRMRNQKKDGAILEQIMATSMGVEPAEISYHANGEFRASRDIFGPLSTENSPVIPTRKKRKTRKTTATLSNLSANAPRMRAPRGRKAAAGRSAQKHKNPSMLASPPVLLKPNLNPLAAGFGRRYVLITEEDEEFRLTVEDMGKKKTFSVFQDGSEASPARTETPLEDHRFDFPTHGLPLFPNDPSNLTRFNASPTPAAKPASYRPFGKENGQPEQPAQQQARRGPPLPSHIYPPQMSHDSSLINPLYNHAYAQGFGIFAQHTYTMTNAPPEYGTSFQGDLKPVNPMLRPQQPQGQGMGSHSNGFRKGMHYNM